MASTAVIQALAAIGGALAPTGDDADDLRLLFTLQEATRLVVTRVIAGATSPVRAAMLVRAAERAHRDAGHLQFQAAAAADRCHVETLTATQLDGIATVFADLAAFLAGGTELPQEPSTGPTGRPLYTDAGEFLAEQLHLTSFAAATRLEAAGNLIAPPTLADAEADPAADLTTNSPAAAQPDTDAVGSSATARYPLLAHLLQEGQADPREVAAAAKKLERLRPDIERQPDPAGIMADFEARLAASVAGTHSGATNKLLRALEAELAATALEPDEAVQRARCGLTYQGLRYGLHYYQLVCDAIDGEYLRSYFDALDNPLSQAGRIPRPRRMAPVELLPSRDSAPVQGSNSDAGSAADLEPIDDLGDVAARDPAPIPDWAIDPGTPAELRPVEDFTDDPPMPSTDWLQPAPTRQAEHLAALLAAMRLAGAPGAGGATGHVTHIDAGSAPVLPAVEIVLHIDYDALRGQTDRAGHTAHGALLSAETVRRLACNANILPIQFDGAGAVLDIGRSKRRFPGHMVRAIAARDGGCCYPGCQMPAARTEIHHIRSWLDGGQTSVSNGCCLCVLHHHSLHVGRFRIVVIDDVPYVLLPRDLDPPQLPRRNTYWHPSWRAA